MENIFWPFTRKQGEQMLPDEKKRKGNCLIFFSNGSNQRLI